MERGVIVRGIMLGVAAMLLVVAAAALWVLFYSVAIAPGHDGAHYQAYGQSVAPLAAIVAGLPILFGAGCVAARGVRPMAAAVIPALTYILLDLALSAIGGILPPVWAVALSWPGMVAAAWTGGWLAARRRGRAAG